MSMPTKKAGDKIEICDLIRQAGIVGAGGAGFPAHVKLSGKADVVIANGVECEPLLETDRHLLLREADRVIIGLKASMKAVGAESGVIAVKRKHSDIIRLLEGLLQNTDKIKIFELDNFYPAGDEHVLLYETTGRVVPMGGIPLNVGAVVSNVHTLALIADSLEGKSFTHRYVTVTGEVNRPAVAKVPIGISIRDAIEGIAGGACSDRFSVIVGGPAMGKLENDLDKPVVKTTGGIIVLPGNHKLVEMKTQSLETAFKRARSVCCQCNFCTEMCPRFLLGHKLQPHKMMRLLPVTDGNIDHGSVYSAALCSECGLCGYYSCTMGLSPNLVNGFLKDVMGRNKIKPDFKAFRLEEVNISRDYRKVPANRLTNRLGLAEYDRHLQFVDNNLKAGRYVLPLKQHIGAHSVPVVKPGDLVDTGTLVAVIPENSIGANLHSPAKGIVKEVSANIVIEA